MSKEMVEYTAVIEPGTNGDVWGYFPEVVGCTTSGNTTEEVRDDLPKKLQTYLEILLNGGGNLPWPFYYGNRRMRAFELTAQVDQDSASYVAFAVPDISGGYTVTVPDLPGLITYGETMKEARRNTRSILKGYLADMRADGESIPQRHHERTALEVYKVAVNLSDLAR